MIELQRLKVTFVKFKDYANSYGYFGIFKLVEYRKKRKTYPDIGWYVQLSVTMCTSNKLGM